MDIVKKIIKRFFYKINRTNQAEENFDYRGDFTKRTRLFGINKYLAKPEIFTDIYIAVVFFIIIAVTLIINSLTSLNMKSLFETGAITHRDVSIFRTLWDIKYLNLFIIIAAAIGYFRFAYKVRTAFSDINVGQKGTSRWTTREEIDEQYKKIAEKKESFKGYGGIPIARDLEGNIYVDDSNTNSIVIGTTRSGKDESILNPMIENLSRAELKCSMVIPDVKLESSTYAIPMLLERGYECHIINCIDPKFSAGYNPLKLIIDEFEIGFKNGNLSVAQTLTVSIAYNLFPKNEHETQPFFTNAARDLFIAGFWAMTEDAYEKDRLDNLKAKIKHNLYERNKEREFYKKLYGSEYNRFIIRRKIDKIIESYITIDESKKAIDYEYIISELKNDFIKNDISEELAEKFTADYVDNLIKNFKYKKGEYEREAFKPTNKAKDSITIYSLIAFIANLQEKNLLDKYFASRDIHNFARLKYQTVKSAASKAKGDIISSFYEKVATYLTEDMAKITYKSTFNLMDIGFGKKPMAVFIGLPDYDSSFDFLTTIFLNQVYFINAKMATAMPNGKVARRVHLLLNEICNLPAIEQLGKRTRVGLGRDLIYTLFVQDFASMNAIYKEDASSIRSNCGNQIYIKAGDEDTTTEFSKLLGNETYTDINRTGRKLSINKEITERAEGRDLLTAEELAKLKKGENIVRRTMKREDLNGNSILTTPIGNLGKYRMKYRYEFLEDIMPSGIRLYKSPSYERIIGENEYLRKNFEDKPVKYANIDLETTDDIDIKNNTAYMNYMVYKLAYFNSLVIYEKDLSADKKATLGKILKGKDKQVKDSIIETEILDETGSVIGKLKGFSAMKLENLAISLMKSENLLEQKDGLNLYNLIHSIKKE